MSGPGARRTGLAGAALAAASAAACVRIDTAPGGISSTQLAATPRAIALGDSLRDSAGAALPVRGLALDVNGATLATAGFRYFYVPIKPDTTRGAPVDTALVVDSASGAVRATRTWVAQQGRVFARVGSSVQLADTLDIVPPPDSVVVTPPADTALQYDCRDPRTAVAADTTVFPFRNTAGPFTVTVRGDSLGARVGVRRWLVRWSLDSLPKRPVPTDSVPGLARRVPAIAVISGALDQAIGYDTTGGGGASSVRLRIRPRVLGPSYADTSFRVVLRVDVIRGAGVPVRGSPVRGDTLGHGVFAVRVHRRSNEGCP